MNRDAQYFRNIPNRQNEENKTDGSPYRAVFVKYVRGRHNGVDLRVAWDILSIPREPRSQHGLETGRVPRIPSPSTRPTGVRQHVPREAFVRLFSIWIP